MIKIKESNEKKKSLSYQVLKISTSKTQYSFIRVFLPIYSNIHDMSRFIFTALLVCIPLVLKHYTLTCIRFIKEKMTAKKEKRRYEIKPCSFHLASVIAQWKWAHITTKPIASD